MRDAPEEFARVGQPEPTVWITHSTQQYRRLVARLGIGPDKQKHRLLSARNHHGKNEWRDRAQRRKLIGEFGGLFGEFLFSNVSSEYEPPRDYGVRRHLQYLPVGTETVAEAAWREGKHGVTKLIERRTFAGNMLAHSLVDPLMIVEWKGQGLALTTPPWPSFLRLSISRPRPGRMSRLFWTSPNPCRNERGEHSRQIRMP